MNQSHARMSRNPERIRERSHPVSSFDWIVSLAGARARRGPLAPAQTASLHLHRGDFYIYIYILTLGSLGHVLPYFPALASSILTRAVTLATGLNVKWPEAVEE